MDSKLPHFLVSSPFKTLGRRSLLCLCLVIPASPVLGTTIVDDDFDDDTVTGWKSIGNVLMADHNITEAESQLTSEVIGTEVNLNTNRGIVSDASFNPLDDPTGFHMTFEIVSQGALQPGANGMFLGITSSNSQFFREEGVSTFGLVFWGLPVRTDSDSGVSLITNDVGAGGPAEAGLILDANPDSIELASFQDGCSVTIVADPIAWSFTVEGINGLDGLATTISNSGTWADAGTDFNTVFGGATDWYVLASNQGEPADATHTVVYDRISLKTGPPPTETELAITSITPNLVGEEPTVTLQWNAEIGITYAVEYSTDLTNGSWAQITDDLVADSTLEEFVHEIAVFNPELIGAEKVFYRITIPES